MDGMQILFFFVFCAKTVAGNAATQNCTVEWSDWSPCFNDTSNGYVWKDRMASLNPGSQDGTPCYDANVNEVQVRDCSLQDCACSDDTTAELSAFAASQCRAGSGWFRCYNGRCIRGELACNGDDDCGDASDEFPLFIPTAFNNCSNRGNYICGIPVLLSASNTPSKSDRYFLGIPGIEKLSGGFDMLTGKFRGNVLSMRPFGSCRRALKSGEADYYYRLPHNINSFSQQYSIYEAPGTIFATGAELINGTHALLADSFSFAGNLQPNDSNVGLSQEQKYKTFVLDSVERSNRFVAVTSAMKVKIFKIKLKSSSHLEMSNAFLQRLYDLPYKSYSYDRYMSFVNDFGTHYVSSATLGGEYTQTNIYDRCWLDEYGEQYGYDEFAYENLQWRKWLTYCDRENMKTKLNPTYAVPQTCLSTTNVNLQDSVTTKNIEVIGGSVSTASSLKESLTSATWQAWADTVAESPSFLRDDFQLERMSSLLNSPIPQLTNSQRSQVKEYLERAINDYLYPYNAVELCGGDKFSDNCRENICTDNNNVDAAVADLQNYTVRYLSGNGGMEYRCMCACLRGPEQGTEECGSFRELSSKLTIIICAVIAIKNLW